MTDFIDLITDSFVDGWMRVSNRYSTNASNQVDVSISLVVVEILPVAFDSQKRLRVVVEVEVGHILFSVFDYLFVGGPHVRSWLVVDCWKGSLYVVVAVSLS